MFPWRRRSKWGAAGSALACKFLPTIVGHFHKSFAIQESVLFQLGFKSSWGGERFVLVFSSALIACKDARNCGKVSYSVWAINKTDLA